MPSAASKTLLIICVGGSIFTSVSGADHVHTVTFSDTPVWTVGIGVAYADMNIVLGETLSFMSDSSHDVVLLHPKSSGAPWSSCGQSGVTGNTTSIWASSDFSSTSMTEKHYTPPSCGDFHVVCSQSAHCMFGQRVKVSVKNPDGSTCSSPCLGAACVTAASKVGKTSGVTHGMKPVANSKWWGQGPFSAMTVDIGDSVVFRTGAGFHDVATLPSQAAFDNCDMTQKTVVADWTFGTTDTSAICKNTSACCSGSACGSTGYYVTYTFNASVAGDVYFICSYGHHCKQGQKVLVTVRSSTTEAPSTGGAANTASTANTEFLIIFFSLWALITFW